MAKKKVTDNRDLLQVRLGDWTVEDVDNLATKIYSFRNKGEFLRALLEYVQEKRPDIVKVYSPKAESLAGATS